MKQIGPLPKTLILASTIAQRVHQLREIRNLTIRDLAKSTKFGIKRIEEIESGLETWFSSTDRQLLAKALSVEPYIIEEVENRYDKDLDVSFRPIPEKVRIDLAEAILAGAERLRCPACGENLKCTIQNALDIDARPIKMARANCLRCPFIL